MVTTEEAVAEAAVAVAPRSVTGAVLDMAAVTGIANALKSMGERGASRQEGVEAVVVGKAEINRQEGVWKQLWWGRPKWTGRRVCGSRCGGEEGSDSACQGC